MSDTLLITGASSSIGCKIIESLNSDQNVIALYNKNKNKFDNIRNKRIISYKIDLSKQDQIEKLITNLENDKLIPNKVLHIASKKLSMNAFQNTVWNEYLENFNVQVGSIFMILKWLMPYMKKNKHGKIVAILSSAVSGTTPGSMSSYVTSKYALHGLIKSLSVEMSKFNVNLNTISPGMMDTEFLSNIPKKILEINNQKVPFGRSVSVDDIVPLINFLLSSDSDFISGVDIPVTGGLIDW
tara:strand:+ start:719 stop:1441 length:723 start_codon:yes stop_codon:yes gene_type:complete